MFAGLHGQSKRYFYYKSVDFKERIQLYAIIFISSIETKLECWSEMSPRRIAPKDI